MIKVPKELWRFRADIILGFRLNDERLFSPVNIMGATSSIVPAAQVGKMWDCCIPKSGSNIMARAVIPCRYRYVLIDGAFVRYCS